MSDVLRGLIALCLVGVVLSPAAAGQHVSFANDVAPILVEQCLVCHNARTSRGRFSVETFAALMKGGESGEAVVPGDGDLSTLVLLAESGEMPKDGDPLTNEQIAVLKRWIAAGAKLDDDKPADKPLPSLLPPPVHPAPPARYPAASPVTALDFSPDGSLLAVSGYREVLLFDPATGAIARRIPNMAERVYGIAFSPAGDLLAVAAGIPGRYGEVRVFQVESGESLATLGTSIDSMLDVDFSPDGNQIVACGADRAVRIWNVADGSEVRRFEDHADWVNAVAFSPDGRKIVSASRDKTVKVFDLATGDTAVTFMEHEAAVHDAVFNHDGSQIASCGADGRLRIWNATTGKQDTNERLGGTGLSIAAAGSEGYLCGTSERSATLRGLDGKRRHDFGDLPDWGNAVAASNGGGLLAIGTADGTVTLVTGPGGPVARSFAARP